MSTACVKNILKGTDVEMATFTFRDDAGTPIPVAVLEDYQIYVYSLNGNKKVLHFTFRKDPVGTDGDIIELDDYTVGFVVNRQQTLKVPLGYLYIEIVAEFPSTSEYILSKKKSGKDGYILCNIVESANPQAML